MRRLLSFVAAVALATAVAVATGWGPVTPAPVGAGDGTIAVVHNQAPESAVVVNRTVGADDIAAKPLRVVGPTLAVLLAFLLLHIGAGIRRSLVDARARALGLGCVRITPSRGPPSRQLAAS